MVVLESSKENKDDKESFTVDNVEGSSLREERRRTGRYVAAGTAIFLSLLGVYQAMVRGTPEYAALFAPAVIMFVYVLWILYASKNRTKSHNIMESEESILTEVTSVGRPPPTTTSQQQEPIKKINKKQLNRSYSIA